MAFQTIKCPDCGANELNKNGEMYHCPYCGCNFTDDSATRAYEQLVENINKQFGSAIDEYLRKEKEERFYALRTKLWEKVHAEYTDSAAIVEICQEIKGIVPNDFVANFYEVANGAPVKELAKFVKKMNVETQAVYVERIIEFLLKSLTSELIAPVNYLIEKAYRNTDLHKYEDYISRLETEASKVDKGLYETSLPRDVFVAYASEDVETVLGLVEELEENGFSCFAALRNLQHGRGAADNYEKEIFTAIDNCKMVVFVSSKYSRNIKRDALRLELPYIKKKDLENAPAGHKLDYRTLPMEYKKPRIEYRLDNEKTMAADIVLKEFFSGLDYCESEEKVLERVVWYSVGQTAVEEKIPAPVPAPTPAPVPTPAPIPAPTSAPAVAQSSVNTSFQTKTPTKEERKAWSQANHRPQTNATIPQASALTVQEKKLLSMREEITARYNALPSEEKIRERVKEQYKTVLWLGILLLFSIYIGIGLLIYRSVMINKQIEHELSERESEIRTYRRLQDALTKVRQIYGNNAPASAFTYTSSSYTLTVKRKFVGGLQGLIADFLPVTAMVAGRNVPLKKGESTEVTILTGEHQISFKSVGSNVITQRINVNSDKTVVVTCSGFGELSVEEK